jgi:hypothetical protein
MSILDDLKLFFLNGDNKWKILPILFLADLMLVTLLAVIGPILYPGNVLVEAFFFSPGLVLDNFVKNTLPYLDILIIGVILEELIFRSPITFLYKYRVLPAYVYASILTLSVLFGLYHFQYFDEFDFVMTLPVFMMGALILSYVYWLCGGKEGKFWKPLIICFLYHLLFNLLTLSVIYNPGLFSM